MGLNSRG